jgi:hypothetical protein
VSRSDLGVGEGEYRLYDIWEKQDLGVLGDSISFDIAGHGSVCLRLVPEV